MHDVQADWFPLDDDQHQAQLAGLLARPHAGPILDLGCGDGRLLVPLAQAGREVVGIDHDEFALALCRQRLAGHPATLIEADLRRGDWPAQIGGPFQTALCLGNTFMLLHDVETATGLLRQVRERLLPGGALYLDDFCPEMWREVAEGYWQEGVSEDGSMQLLWAPGENVIALRYGEAVDEQAEAIRPDDTLCRLWTLGELRLLAELSGLQEPERLPEQHLLRFARF